jgi:hypothetical protein
MHEQNGQPSARQVSGDGADGAGGFTASGKPWQGRIRQESGWLLRGYDSEPQKGWCWPVSQPATNAEAQLPACRPPQRGVPACVYCQARWAGPLSFPELCLHSMRYTCLMYDTPWYFEHIAEVDWQ